MTEFDELFGRGPAGTWVAPGRVNLIGEHTDHTGGLVLPVAVDRSCAATVARRVDGVVRCWSAQEGAGTEVHLDDVAPGGVEGWSAYVAGVAWALREAGLDVTGADVLVDSDVPGGAGLSSSAALTCSVGLALWELSGEPLDRTALALAAQRAETDVVGAPVGAMDQLVSVHGATGAAVLLDCRSLEVQHVPLPLADAGLALVVVDTGVTHAHSTGGYATRREECRRAEEVLGPLRDTTPEQVDAAAQRLGEVLHRRARHVVTENRRVERAAAALRAGDLAALGEVLAAGHASLRDDFEVSTVELDVAVDAALSAGAVAARMTGGGFGGSVVVLAPAERVPDVDGATRAAADARGLPVPTTHVLSPGAGARRTA